MSNTTYAFNNKPVSNRIAIKQSKIYYKNTTKPLKHIINCLRVYNIKSKYKLNKNFGYSIYKNFYKKYATISFIYKYNINSYTVGRNKSNKLVSSVIIEDSINTNQYNFIYILKYLQFKNILNIRLKKKKTI
jgi:hypothetical protein